MDSGNGIQVLWRLETPIDLDRKDKEAEKRTNAIEDAEARAAAAMRSGSV